MGVDKLQRGRKKSLYADKKTIKTYLWFFKFCFEGTKKESLKWLGLAIIQALVFVGQLYFTKTLINSLRCFLNDDASKEILYWFGFFVLILTGEFILNLLIQKTMFILKKRQGLYVKKNLVKAAQNYPLGKFTLEFSNNTAWLFENSENLTYTTVEIAHDSLFYLPVFLGLVLLWPASLRYILFSLIGLAAVLFYLPVNTKTTPNKPKDYFLKLLLEPSQNKTNAKENYLLEKHQKIYWQSCKAEDLYLLQTGFLNILQKMVFLGFSLSLFLGGRYAATLSLGDIFIFYKTVTLSYDLVIKAKANRNKARVSKPFLTQLQEMLEQAKISKETEEGDTVIKQISEQIGLEVKNLNYFYDNKSVLKEISFKIKPGEKVAIIGAKGSRKNTLIKSLLGIYKPQTGTFFLGGIPTHQLTAAQRTKYVAVFLRPVKYPLSIKENITFQAIPSDELFESVTRGLKPQVKNLPEGLETTLTKNTLKELKLTHEVLAKLWQNIFLARLLYRQTPIVVCVEPQNLSTDFWQHFPSLFKTKTVLWFSDNAASGRFFDRVVLLKAGQIVEAGTYEKLVRLGGEYATLLKAQGGKM